MPNVVDITGTVVFTGKSDAECARWWRTDGDVDDRLEDTGEFMEVLQAELGLDA